MYTSTKTTVLTINLEVQNVKVHKHKESPSSQIQIWYGSKTTAARRRALTTGQSKVQIE